MKKNMGTLDRGLRIVLAVVVAILYISGSITGLAALILGILAVIFLVTGLIGFCPLYVPLGISTVKKKKEAAS
jgi:hypothetical protein